MPLPARWRLKGKHNLGWGPIRPQERRDNGQQEMAGLAILKHMYDLSDEALCERWLENPYFQLLCGEESFHHTQRSRGRSASCQARHEEPTTVVNRCKLVEARSDLACVHLHSVSRHRTVLSLRLVTDPVRVGRTLSPCRVNTLWIVSGESGTACERNSSCRSRFTPSRRSRRRPRIRASCVSPTFSAGERCGRRLRASRPAAPSCSYRRSHLRWVGRETPERRHTAPASPSA